MSRHSRAAPLLGLRRRIRPIVPKRGCSSAGRQSPIKNQKSKTPFPVFIRVIFYHAAKRSQTEHVQLDQIEVRFPKTVLKDPSVLVAYVEIFPHAQYFN